MSAARKDRSPWPMRWIVLAIVLFVPVYTWLTLHYRRPGPAFRPYQDMRDRADVVRLLKAGYKRVAIDARPPSEPIPETGVAASPAPGSLPPELRKTLVESPLLPPPLPPARARVQALPGHARQGGCREAAQGGVQARRNRCPPPLRADPRNGRGRLPGSRQPASGAEKDARRVPSPSPRDRRRVGGPGRRLGDRLSDRAHLHAARQQAAAVGGPPLRAGGRDCHRS